MSSISRAAFIEQINYRAESQPPAAATTHSITAGGSRVTVRDQGGFITEASLQDAQGNIVPLFYSAADGSVAKLNASHVMMPAGPFEGVGGQHGFPRWADYDVASTANRLRLVARTPEDFVRLEREIQLAPSHLTLTTRVTNLNDASLHTSLGEHFYFLLPHEDADGLEIGIEPEHLMPVPDLAAIMQGEAYFWDDFDGTMQAVFPDGRAISISSTTTMSDDRAAPQAAQAPSGMLIWHRPGTPSICLEPVIGSNSLPDNTHLEIKSGHTATMQTIIRMQ